MDSSKIKAINGIVDAAIYAFAQWLFERNKKEASDPNGVINMKKKNCFVAELWEEFMFYSAFVRSFDSSFWIVLENIGNNIAKLSYDVRNNIKSFILPEQTSRISSIMDSYLKHESVPCMEHYSDFSCIYPSNITSFEREHVTDNYFYDGSKNEHYLIELKAWGNLDNKKARAEKQALLEEYFLLKNQIRNDKSAKIKIFFGTAYNMFWEWNTWRQWSVEQFFAKDELLIGKDYWNFACNDSEWFNIIFEQYKKSAEHIRKALKEIKSLYF